jgi:hypothetical protein
MAEESSISSIWGRRVAGIDINEADIFRPVSHEDVAYLLHKYPFLQMINSDARFEGEIIPKFVEAESGWVIHDYGDAMSSSPGENLFGGWNDLAFLKAIMEEEGKEGGKGGAIIEPGKGTIVKQMVDTAFAMIDLAIAKKWTGIEIIDGTELMKWAAWAAASEKQFLVEGFAEKEADKKKYERVVRHRRELAAAAGIQPTV